MSAEQLDSVGSDEKQPDACIRLRETLEAVPIDRQLSYY